MTRLELPLAAALVLLSAGAAISQEDPVTVEALVDQVKANDYDAQGTAVKLGPTGSEALIPLVESSEEYRLLAAICLNLTGGPKAAAKGLELLADRDQQLVSIGIKILHRTPPEGHEDELLQLYGSTRDEFLRAQLPVIASRLQSPHPARWLELEKGRHRWPRDQAEPGPEQILAVANPGLVKGVARMGNAPAQREFNRRVARAKGEALRGWIEEAVAIKEPWVVDGLSSLLGDEQVLIEIGADGMPKTLIRACDLAVWGIAEVSGQDFGFKVDRYSNYSPSQREVVRRKLVSGGGSQRGMTDRLGGN